MIAPLDQAEFDTAHLMTEHPPVWHHSSKKLVFAIACPPGTLHGGRLRYSRWPAFPLPARIAGPPALDFVLPRPDFYDYQPIGETEPCQEWHVNFADPRLFVAYSSSLLAQDEMQVAEHPALGALCEALQDRESRPRTMQGDAPTPILITGAERHCRIDTDPNPALGRPLGLYGNRFARATDDVIRQAVTRIAPPPITHFIAISALPGGYGYYTAAQIRYTLIAAYTGFKAAVDHSANLSTPSGSVIHSGFWGCGAFGGNRVLMTMIQMLAASAAGARRLVLHTGDSASLRVIAEAHDHLQEIFFTPTISPSELVQHFVDRRYPWGESDGN